MSSSPNVVPFTIDFAQPELDDLRRRLLATRWPDAVVTDASQGTAPSDLRRLVEFWASEFDWRAAERRLNALEHVVVRVSLATGGDRRVHAVRAGTPGATPLLLIHGWPDGFVRFERALPLLADRFELVIPSVPGFGFSDIPTTPLAMGPANTADALAGLMTELGFETFGVHGADIGSSIAEQLALRHPGRVTALHLGDVPLRRLRGIPSEHQTDAERAWTARAQQWELLEGAYGHIQRTKPQTLAAALNDSPAGLASWQLEKYTSWSDGDDGASVFDRFSLDELATTLTIYWVTRTAGSAARYYFDTVNADLTTAQVEVPTGVALFPRDLLAAPRESAERWYRIERWTQMPRGGHFGPWEQPELWSAEITAFFDQIGL